MFRDDTVKHRKMHSAATINCIALIGLTCLMATLVNSQQPHIAVLENDAQEDLLPIEYRNPFLRTPRVRALLDRSSWFGPGENQVYDREADRIDRSEIYSVLAHAGFIPRRRFS